MVFKIWSSLFLLVCTVIDLKTKKVYPWMCIVNYVLVIGIKILLNKIELKALLLGLAISAILFAVSIITKEAIGRGDVWILLTLTGILNGEGVLEILFTALFICSVFSIVMLATKKMKMKNALPFVPFLLIGNVLWILFGGEYVL